MNEITDFCENECGSSGCCPEDDCILYRIENIIDDRLNKCCLCGEGINGFGNNAEPIKEGQCCDKCNEERVIPERLKDLL